MYFTICIPVYNRKNTILRTLESVKNQQFGSYEVIIVDDGSTDGAGYIIETYIAEYALENQFHYIFKENGGKHTCLNIGIEMAQGMFFTILDSDDWLFPDALNKLYDYCKKIENDKLFCGIMGKSINSANNKVIGDAFDLSNPVSSYFEYHFIFPQKMLVLDSFEANKTVILKEYRFPEEKNMKFVPEAWLFDQLGVKYKLLLTNEPFRYVEYLPDGMTKDKYFKEKNAPGFLYHYISRIENVLNKKKMPLSMKAKLYTVAWWRYWQCVDLDKEKKGPRIKKVSLFGKIVKIGTPCINYIFEKKYKKYV